MKTLRRIKIEGFKSIERAELELGDLNVVIGANGSGKSNLLGAFRLLERVLSGKLQVFVASAPDRFLHHGRKTTPALSLGFDFTNDDSYEFALEAVNDSLVFKYENVRDDGGLAEDESEGIRESQFLEEYMQIFHRAFKVLKSFALFHFEDTSDSSPARQTACVDDNRVLYPNAANLPAYLYWLQKKHPVQFRHIEEHIRLVAPFFERFVLAPLKLNERNIKLEWRHKGSDAYFDAWSLSDGTLRFICLATLLLQPEPPALILLDEPELGLHPLAIRILAEMLDVASKQTQILVATQSVTLLDNFPIEQVIITDHDGRGSLFRRLKEDDYRVWLENFSVGELWEKNVLGGRP